MISQRTWRITGVVCLAVDALLVWYGVSYLRFNAPVWFLLVYWTIFLVLLIAAFVMAMLDLRYIRLLYALEQRRIFHETIGNPEFHDALRHARHSTPPGAGEE